MAKRRPAILRPIITLPRGTAQKMCQAEGVSKTALYAALNFTSFSDEAERIRKVAISLYGGVKTSKLIP